jgi:hypothetical protein
MRGGFGFPVFVYSARCGIVLFTEQVCGLVGGDAFNSKGKNGDTLIYVDIRGQIIHSKSAGCL